jgi:hypothetical protein
MSHLNMAQLLRALYRPSPKGVEVVDVPDLPFLMIDGAGNPNTAPAYAAAVEALYTIAYTLKFMLKRGPAALDYPVMPLEGLWWADDMAAFATLSKDDWRWTMMIAQPAEVTEDLLLQAAAQAAKKKRLPALPLLRLERFCEGPAAQIMHIGPYAAEAPTIQGLHHFIADQGYALRGKHHEIYISDPRRAAPEKLKTIIRQPIERTH